MTGADLRGASFRGANLAGAHLNATNLDAAFFEDATLTDVNLQGAYWTDATVWPRGVTPPSSREPDVPWWQQIQRQPRESMKILWKKIGE